jgi:hypothetical protein
LPCTSFEGRTEGAQMPKKAKPLTEKDFVEELKDLRILKSWDLIKIVSLIFRRRFSKREDWADLPLVERFVRLIEDEFSEKGRQAQDIIIPKLDFIAFIRSPKIVEWIKSVDIKHSPWVKRFFGEIVMLDRKEKMSALAIKEYNDDLHELWETLAEEESGYKNSKTPPNRSKNKGGRPSLDPDGSVKKAILKHKGKKLASKNLWRRIKNTKEINHALSGENRALPTYLTPDEYKNKTGFKPSTVDKYVKIILEV